MSESLNPVGIGSPDAFAGYLHCYQVKTAAPTYMDISPPRLVNMHCTINSHPLLQIPPTKPNGTWIHGYDHAAQCASSYRVPISVRHQPVERLVDCLLVDYEYVLNYMLAVGRLKKRTS